MIEERWGEGWWLWEGNEAYEVEDVVEWKGVVVVEIKGCLRECTLKGFGVGFEGCFGINLGGCLG